MNIALFFEQFKSTGVQNDSRLVQPGDLFLAYPGANSDGRNYIADAVSKGAAAVFYDPDRAPKFNVSIPVFPIPQLANHLKQIADYYYHEAMRGCHVVGVTGTNGKTTIAYQLTEAHDAFGRAAAYIGTLGQGRYDALKNLNNTTPDVLCLHRLFDEYRKMGVRQICMEVSSHALSQGRVDGIPFQQAIFTNLTHDHLDYHQTMEAYAAAKAKLFAWPTLAYAILNADDPASEIMASACLKKTQKLRYGLKKNCDVHAAAYQMNMNGTQLTVDSPWGRVHLNLNTIGEFNIYNTLAVFSSLMLSGYDADEVIPMMSLLHPSPGRMEIVTQSPTVIVDYAHTPDALEKALLTLKALKKRELIVVFGCGGDRDKTKRPLMGRIACQYADKIVLTSDNPRTEVPQAIIEDIVSGIDDFSHVIQILDRKEAILETLKHADPDDLILIAGKGHEDYQQIGTEKFPFSDQKVVKNFFIPYFLP